uniref:Uncharacterized protein n=1 Tax=Romanomermis culicivorax TaxID=13658 RepID=A0A915J196_ROMCU
MQIEETVNESLHILDTSPLKVRRLGRRDKPGYVVRKIQRVKKVIADKITTASGISTTDGEIVARLPEQESTIILHQLTLVSDSKNIEMV